jgi:hypothetical protein
MTNFKLSKLTRLTEFLQSVNEKQICSLGKTETYALRKTVLSAILNLLYRRLPKDLGQLMEFTHDLFPSNIDFTDTVEKELCRFLIESAVGFLFSSEEAISTAHRPQYQRGVLLSLTNCPWPWNILLFSSVSVRFVEEIYEDFSSHNCDGLFIAQLNKFDQLGIFYIPTEGRIRKQLCAHDIEFCISIPECTEPARDYKLLIHRGRRSFLYDDVDAQIHPESENELPVVTIIKDTTLVVKIVEARVPGGTPIYLLIFTENYFHLKKYLERQFEIQGMGEFFAVSGKYFTHEVTVINH